MISRVERALIARYLWPGIGGRLVLLVAGIGVAGVTIGVASLILVMAVMNGAEAKLVAQIASADGHAEITRPGQVMADWRPIVRAARAQPGVVAAVPALETPVMAVAEGRTFGATLRGLPAAGLAAPLFRPGRALLLGRMPDDDRSLAFGKGLAERLGVSAGSRISLMRPVFRADGSLDTDLVGYRVSGIVETGDERVDGARVITTLAAAQALVGGGDVVSRVDVTTVSAERAGAILAPLARALRGRAVVRTWRELNAALFDALAVEHVSMFAILSFVVLVALFNILSSLMMLVRSKRREIAILRTMGTGRAAIARVFVGVGSAIGMSGGVAGTALGLALVWAKAPIVEWARDRLLGGAWAAETSVFLDLPFTVGTREVASILAMTLSGSVLATLWPAWRAAAIDPAAVLRYE